MPRSNAFREVTAKARCAICDSDHWCQVTLDGGFAMCRRVAEGGRYRLDRNGSPYWIHRLSGEARPVRHPSAHLDATADRASAALLDEVYRTALGELGLSREHQQYLSTPWPAGKSLPPEEVVRRGYASLPPAGPPWRREEVARRLVERFGAEALAGVPGFVQKERRWRPGVHYWTVAGADGLLVPVRDAAGLVVALLVRADHPRNPRDKYLWLTSKSAGGPSPGSRAHVPLPRSEVPAVPGTVSVYEGILKADCAAALDPASLPAVGIPGHSSWRAALPILQQLGASAVRYYPDPDAWEKPAVGQSLKAFWKALKDEGFSVELGRFAGC